MSDRPPIDKGVPLPPAKGGRGTYSRSSLAHMDVSDIFVFPDGYAQMMVQKARLSTRCVTDDGGLSFPAWGVTHDP